MMMMMTTPMKRKSWNGKFTKTAEAILWRSHDNEPSNSLEASNSDISYKTLVVLHKQTKYDIKMKQIQES